MAPPPMTDVGTLIAQTILDAISTALDAAGLDPPSILSQFTGAATPVADACEGMIWARVSSTFPTDGSGALFTSARIDMDIPAWAFTLDVGVLWCHTNITEDGGFIDSTQESDYAARDGAYRMAIFNALSYIWPDMVRADAAGLRTVVDSRILSPWTSIGPDGGYSGGVVNLTVVTNSLAVCP